MRHLIAGTLCLVLFLGSVFTSNAQQHFEYTPLASSGELPEELIMGYTEILAKREEAQAGIAGENLHRSTEKFIERSTFSTTSLLGSGFVLFNDPISNYLNEIKDHLLKDTPEDQERIQIYLMRQTEANAFATEIGAIFVTTGLVAEVENEAQLAFIIAHEITHVKRNHIVNSFRNENQKLKRSNRIYTQVLDELSAYSKELELESDGLGFELFANAGYDLEEAVNTMDVLQFSYLPLDEIPFHLNDFSGDLRVPDILYPDSIKEIDLDGDLADDSRSTHPNLSTRRDALYDLMDYEENSNEGVIYQFDQSRFNELRYQARMESLKMMLGDARYTEVYHETCVLENIYGNNKDIQRFRAKSLYGMAKYKLHDLWYTSRLDYHDAQGELSVSAFFFDEMNEEAALSLAAYDVYNYMTKYPDDEFMVTLAEDIMIEYRLNGPSLDDALTLSAFDEPEEEEREGEGEEEKVEEIEREMTKLERLRAEREAKRSAGVSEDSTGTKSAALNEDNFYLALFGRLSLDSAFVSFYDSLEERANEEAEERDDRENFFENDWYTFKANQNRQIARKGLQRNLENPVFVNPFFYKYNKDFDSDAHNSGVYEERVHASYQRMNDEFGLKHTLLSEHQIDIDVTTMNRISLLNDWFFERLNHGNIPMIPLNAEYVWDYPDTFETEAFVFTGVLSYRQPQQIDPLTWVYSTLLYPLLPLTILAASRPRWTVEVPTMAFDLRSGDCLLNQNFTYQQRLNDIGVTRIVHDSMSQLIAK
ncbi:MAG: M48 family metallopeptidase [Flavobacteriales bacterium]|nr:M48 family metallopeptidase [Flavobacteriales bacterium]